MSRQSSVFIAVLTELLKKTVIELNRAKLEVKRQNIIIEESSYKQEQASHREDKVALEKTSGDKDKTLDQIAQLREKRTELVDRLSLVLDEQTKKLGLTDDGKELEEVFHYRHYIKSVGHRKGENQYEISYYNHG